MMWLLLLLARGVTALAPSAKARVVAPTAEARVVASIKGVARAGFGAETLGALAEFGTSTGDLVLQQWLTPETLESCACFWQDGSTAAARDARRLSRWRWREAKAAGAFAAIAASTFPFTPLLLPLFDEALEETDQATYVPSSFSPRRLRALRRLSGEPAFAAAADTPRNATEGLRFFADGTALVARDLRRRGTLLRGDEDSWPVWLRFLALSFSTFPITPLLLPVIDKRRDGPRSDYVPSAYRPRRLRALQRLRRMRASADPVATLRSVSREDERPRPTAVLDAIVRAQRLRSPTSDEMRDALAGGGSPGRRWELAYVADKAAVISARSDEEDVFRPLARLVVPWLDGVFVDGFVSAIQRFDLETLENENGVFALFGSDVFKTTVKGPFKWSKRGVCAFRPDAATFDLGPFSTVQAIEEEGAFEDVPYRDLPFFKFIHVDDKVAVAQGRSGSVALWTRLADS